MSARTRISFIWLWMAALLIASTGVSVQQVYCYCLGKTTVYFFNPVDACQTPFDAATPGQLSGPDCCSKKARPSNHACCEKPDAEKQGCTKKTTQVFQLKTEFEVASSEFKKLDFPNAGAIAPGFSLFTQPIPALRNEVSLGFEHPPPPRSGRMICLRHGVFRC